MTRAKFNRMMAKLVREAPDNKIVPLSEAGIAYLERIYGPLPRNRVLTVDDLKKHAA